MSDRFRAGYEHVLHHLGLDTDAVPPRSSPEADAEHRAVLELLVATMYADATVAERELRAIDEYGAEQGWNGLTFSFVQGMGAATERVRAARQEPHGLDALLRDADAAITTPDLRSAVVTACRRIAQADGTVAGVESAWLDEVAKTFT